MPNAGDAVLKDTQAWLERAVIGLNLCPFARAPFIRGQVNFVISTAAEPEALLQDLGAELDALVTLAAAQRETTLLIAPDCLHDFIEYNVFMGRAQRHVRKRGLEGVVQLAGFHPDYQFADALPGDITNFTNRSPYPIVHLLREASVERAVQSIDDPAAIFETNKATLRRLGDAGWQALDVGRSA